MKRRLSLLLLLSLLLAAACGPAPEAGDATPQPEGDEATATAPAPAVEETTQPVEPYPVPQMPSPTPLPDDYPVPPTLAPAPTFDPYPAPEGEGTATAGTAEPAAPVGEGLPVGLVYEAEEATWVVGPDGAPTGLYPQTGLEISPDGGRAAYVENDDIFVLDLATGETVNVTEGSDRAHLFVAWWPAQPEVLLAGSQGAEDAGPNLGRLTLIAADGSSYEVVGEEVSFALPEGAHDGTRIAYDEGGQPFVYDGTRAPFDVAGYTLPEGVSVTRVASPAWSPDDSALAWMMGIEREGEPEGEEIALGIFDLEAQTADAHTARVIHPYVTLGRGGWFTAPRWSPDGDWVVFPVETGDESRGMWVAAADGSSEQLLGGDTFSPAFWLPDGSAVLVSIPQQEVMALARYATGTWEEMLLDLAHTRLVGWAP